MTYPREQINQGIFLSLSHPFDDHNDPESSGPLKDSNILMLKHYFLRMITCQIPLVYIYVTSDNNENECFQGASSASSPWVLNLSARKRPPKSRGEKMHESNFQL